MVKNIEPKLRKIGDYLKLEDDIIFTIPEYQRAYSWGIGHCDKLWHDFIDYVLYDYNNLTALWEEIKEYNKLKYFKM